MSLTCDVIRDLLPLYAENMVSDDTRLLVEKHLADCPDCRERLAAMQTAQTLPGEVVAAPFKKLKGRLFWKRIEVIVLTATLVLAAAITVGAYLTAPEYLPYSESLLSFYEGADGTVFVTFNEDVVGYDFGGHAAEDGAVHVYHITAWTNLWQRFFPAHNTQSLVLKAESNQTVTVYYYLEGAEDTFIYGKDLYPNGGTLTLPRLALGYYALLATVLLVIGVLLWFACRGHSPIRDLVGKMLLLPASYLVAHLCIKGFSTSSYALSRDLAAILLVMLPIYCASLLALRLYRKHELIEQTRM